MRTLVLLAVFSIGLPVVAEEPIVETIAATEDCHCFCIGPICWAEPQGNTKPAWPQVPLTTPEPSTALLLLTGVPFLLMRRRR